MRTRKEKPIFRGLTIAATGNLGGGAQWTDTNIARWVGLRLGRFVRVGAVAAGGVEKGGGGVKTALRRRTCELVTLDWLEDSMMQGRKLPEEPYSHLRALRKEREKERPRQGILKGLELAVRQVNPNFYHIYCDELFWYKVTLTRGDEKYVLTLFESNNAHPHLYWFVARFYRAKGAQPNIHRPSQAPAVFAQEYDLFAYLFQIKTGVSWEQRLVMTGPVNKGLFTYQPPTGGKPVGWAPVEYRPLEGEPVVVSGGGGGNGDAAVADASGTAATTATTAIIPNTITVPTADANDDQGASNDAVMQVDDANDDEGATNTGTEAQDAGDCRGANDAMVGVAADAQDGEGIHSCQVEATLDTRGGERVISSIVAPVA
ncbi:hypothetical protein C8A05DRAFT_38670 [Staphylotrichum tortipilum]|uniref:BRCT domain-containing protein n=1 Tax=Staphylotrichum tortipilum TaxID=2831512 RepID=A0AAN6RPU6_9PEZI|nr:hypothetical protein C8A05DRAFT_38670 [Staphylotrichum longicolle]